MRNYNLNVQEYLSDNMLGEIPFEPGKAIPYIPAEELEATTCTLEAITRENGKWGITLHVVNDFDGENYSRTYEADKGTKLELNTFEIGAMCFMPPEKIPVLVEVTDISEKSVSLKITGILQGFADDLSSRGGDLF